MKNFLFLIASISLCASSALAADTITGKVSETMDSGGYTYAHVVQGKTSIWVAAPQMKLKVGDAASFQNGMVMTHYQSPTLHRHFDQIVFSAGPAGKMAHVGAPTAKKDVSVKTAKAAGPDGRTVAELYSQRVELAGKTASVRGKVVKVNHAIMGRNWIHLQDGTGDAKAGTFDLVVTTDGEAKIGETITASGAVAKDQDFGMGYKYAVLIEKAALTR
jgi:hypothetical protein